MSENQLAVGSGQSAGGGDARAEARRRGGPYGDGRTPLTTTIRWHRTAERMPAYGLTVVVWIEALGITVRAYRGIPGDMWRVAGTSANGFHTNLITAWTDAPNGPLPAPDGGAA